MRVQLILGIAVVALTLSGCSKAGPAVIKAISGGGAKAATRAPLMAAPKALPHLHPNAVPHIQPKVTPVIAPKGMPATARHPHEGHNLLGEFGKELGQRGLEYGLNQGDNQKKQ